jgi:hypothetical protein
VTKGGLLDQIPQPKLEQIVAILRASFPDLDSRELTEQVVHAWRDGYRSIMGLHDRAQHVLQYGRQA